MWTAPTPRMLQIYNGLTVLCALASSVVFLQLILRGLNAGGGGETGDGFVVGAVWLAFPLISLVGVAIANFPSLRQRAKVWLSGGSLLFILVFCVIPLTILFYT